MLSRNKGFTLVDLVDFPEASKRRWALSAGKYASSCEPGGKRVYLHRMLLGVTSRATQVDHINHQTLDNRRKNLRIVSNSQNQQNRRAKHRGLKGVCFYPHNLRNPWTATITCDGKEHFLGYFATKEAAAWSYDEKAKELFGKHALLNGTPKPSLIKNPSTHTHLRKRKGASSMFFGVSYNTKEQKWVAQLWLESKTIRLGAYDTEVEAAKAYDAALTSRKLTGRPLNFS